MSPSQIMEATKRYEQYKIDLARKRVHEKQVKQIEIKKAADDEKLKEKERENKLLRTMTEAQRKKYFHDKSHAMDHLNEFKKREKSDNCVKKPKPLSSD